MTGDLGSTHNHKRSSSPNSSSSNGSRPVKGYVVKKVKNSTPENKIDIYNWVWQLQKVQIQ